VFVEQGTLIIQHKSSKADLIELYNIQKYVIFNSKCVLTSLNKQEEKMIMIRYLPKKPHRSSSPQSRNSSRQQP